MDFITVRQIPPLWLIEIQIPFSVLDPNKTGTYWTSLLNFQSKEEADQAARLLNKYFLERIHPLVEALEYIERHCDPAGLNGSSEIARKALEGFHGK